MAEAEGSSPSVPTSFCFGKTGTEQPLLSSRLRGAKLGLYYMRYVYILQCCVKKMNKSFLNKKELFLCLKLALKIK